MAAAVQRFGGAQMHAAHLADEIDLFRRQAGRQPAPCQRARVTPASRQVLSDDDAGIAAAGPSQSLGEFAERALTSSTTTLKSGH